MEQAIHGNLKGFDVNFLFVSLFSDIYFSFDMVGFRST